MHAHEVHPYKMQPREVYAHETHAYEMHARKVHAHETPAHHCFVALWPEQWSIYHNLGILKPQREVWASC
jgi:hypothetical protein